jgi:hypothetical protein
MAAMTVIPTLDELEDCDACFALGFEAAAANHGSRRLWDNDSKRVSF